MQRPWNPLFSIATLDNVARACALADAAFDVFRKIVPEARAHFLEEVSVRVEGIGEPLIERAMAESGLPLARLTGERGRTTGQLRLLPNCCVKARAGVVIERALPNRNPPRANLRQRRIAIGPVAVFGAASIIVRCTSLGEMRTVLAAMEGQLTATLQMDDGDIEAARTMLPLLERKVGRILANGWPTGVEVSRAMVHGGPFPATSDTRTTSVGTAAIKRFLRPVCYQDLPDALLPQIIRSDNPLGVPRFVD